MLLELCLPLVEGSRSTVAALIDSSSVSFVTILNDTGVSSLVLARSLAATGASFTALTVIVISVGKEDIPRLFLTV
jgi:metal-dependent hydrolase (beta-lactamase superfamily II)